MGRRPPATFFAALFIFSLLLLEAMAAVHFEFFSRYFWRPRYLRSDSVLAWRTEYEPWGAWHKPNSTAFHVLPCVSVTYRSNSYGARDVERASPGAKNSALFLGDSFIEGLGATDEERVSNIFEQRTGKASINLGSGADVGPLQYWMLFDAFAPRWTFDTVVIGFFPANDFTDNDPDFSRWTGAEEAARYRPYYKKTPAGYEIFHKGTYELGRTLAHVSASALWRQVGTQPLGLNAGWKSELLQYTWVGGFLFSRRGQLQARNIDVSLDTSNIGYFETSRERLEATEWFMDEIVRRASQSGAKVYIMIIPTYAEARALRTRPSPWLPEFVTKFQSRASIIDLGPIYAGLPDDALRSAFLECDGHWSPRGNSIAAGALLKAVADGAEGADGVRIPEQPGPR